VKLACVDQYHILTKPPLARSLSVQAALPLVHPAVQGSQLEDIWSPTTNTSTSSQTAAAFKSSSGCGVELGPGDVLYIPRYWWHHVEQLGQQQQHPQHDQGHADVTATGKSSSPASASPAAAQKLSITVSFSLERRHLPPVQPGSAAHRVDVVRRLEGGLAKVASADGYISLLAELDAHLDKAGARLASFPSNPAWKHALEVLDYLWEGGDAEDPAVQQSMQSFRHPGETKEQFVQWAVHNRFGGLVQHRKGAAVPRHQTDMEEVNLPPLPTENELHMREEGKVEDARAKARADMEQDAAKNIKLHLKEQAGSSAGGVGGAKAKSTANANANANRAGKAKGQKGKGKGKGQKNKGSKPVQAPVAEGHTHEVVEEVFEEEAEDTDEGVADDGGAGEASRSSRSRTDL
jgi:hypothetical protein